MVCAEGNVSYVNTEIAEEDLLVDATAKASIIELIVSAFPALIVTVTRSLAANGAPRTLPSTAVDEPLTMLPILVVLT